MNRWLFGEIFVNKQIVVMGIENDKSCYDLYRREIWLWQEIK
jgi:hypothetical protein